MQRTSMKTLFFVRHGETEGNKQNAYQFETVPLSEEGLRQAAFVTERFKTIPIETIISSDFVRASQTAATIGTALNLPIEHSPFLQEIHRPEVVRGKRKDSPEAQEIMHQIQAHFADPEWHHSNEENFFDLKARAQKAIQMIVSHSEERILIVTHGFMLRMIVMVMAFGEELTPEVYRKLDQFFVVKNTGITMVQENKGVYSLLTWNDHAHLGEANSVPHMNDRKV